MGDIPVITINSEEEENIYLREKKSMFINTSDEKIIKDLKYLRKRLLTETDPNVRIEIQKKIEIITSFYN